MSLAPDTETFARPEALLRVPVGLASPLWGLFAGAAVSGAAWWWMTRWTRIENLEAMFGAAARAEAAIEPQAGAPAEPVVEAAAEPPPETAQALEAAAVGLELAGGESAPIPPVVELLGPEAAPDAAAARPKKPAARPA